MKTRNDAMIGPGFWRHECERLEVLADAGYSNGEHLDICERNGITATLPRRVIPGSAKEFFQKQDFVYDTVTDSYRCPAGQVLTRGGQDKRRNLHL